MNRITWLTNILLFLIFNQGKTAMPGMKRDCGGAAGILGAFYAAVNQGKTKYSLR